MRVYRGLFFGVTSILFLAVKAGILLVVAIDLYKARAKEQKRTHQGPIDRDNDHRHGKGDLDRAFLGAGGEVEEHEKATCGQQKMDQRANGQRGFFGIFKIDVANSKQQREGEKAKNAVGGKAEFHKISSGQHPAAENHRSDQRKIYRCM